MNLYDLAYAVGVAAAAPVWATRKKSRDKVLGAFRERFGRVPPRTGDAPAIWIHAVSLGEINAARTLVEQLLAAREQVQIVVSTTTTTGHERALNLYSHSPRVSVIRYPLDFSLANRRALEAIRPSVVVLMELETWPNFLRECVQRKIPVVLANGRMTTHSFSRYRWIRPIVATMFRRLAAVCVQDAEYAKRFVALGAPPEKVKVAGTMKYDTADVADTVAGASQLQFELQLEQDQPLWVCGSTGPGEEAIALRVYKKLQPILPALRLAIIPRHPQRFDEVAELIRKEYGPLLRRSETIARAENESSSYTLSRSFDELSRVVPMGEGQGEGRSAASSATVRSEEPSPPPSPMSTRERGQDVASIVDHSGLGIGHSALGTSPPAVLLGDTMGELRKFYASATVVFVGRSLVNLGSRQHGSDMIEPAALGRPCVVGPFTGNFDQAVRALKHAQAIVEVGDEADLNRAVEALLRDSLSAAAMGHRAQDVIRQQQGSTAIHAKVILEQLERSAV